MKKTKAKILLVEDNELGRREISTLIGDNFGYQVCAPGSLQQLREALTFESFDSLLVDMELSDFEDIGDTLGDQTINDVTDVLLFYSDLHEKVSGHLYSSHITLPGSPYDKKIKKTQNTSFPFTVLAKPLPPDMKQIIN